MTYLSLEDIKHQLVIDDDFIEDDEYLKSLGDTAERLVDEHTDFKLSSICEASRGELPSTLKMAMLMIVDFLYDQRGSSDKDIPNAFYVLCQPYKTYNIA